MTRFTEILQESKKTYSFLVRIAGDLPESFEATMKTSLEKFDLVSVTGPKRTPIKETTMDFPLLQNMEVHTFEVTVNYPTTSHVMEMYLVDCCGVAHTHLNVRVPGEPVELDQQQKMPEVYDPLLTKEDMGGESAQDSVGGQRVMDLLKELEVARKEAKYSPIAGVKAGDQADITNEENAESVVGS